MLISRCRRWPPLPTSTMRTVSTRIPFELINNHIYASGSIDGKPARFLVDTGGVNLLTPAAAEKFGIVGEGKMAAGGVGDQRVDLALAHAKQVRVGDAVLDRPVFYIIDLGKLAEGRRERSGRSRRLRDVPPLRRDDRLRRTRADACGAPSNSRRPRTRARSRSSSTIAFRSSPVRSTACRYASASIPVRAHR